MLVEEEEVFDPHQCAPLGGTGHETIQNTCCDEGLQARRCSRPGTCCQRERLKEEDDGQSSKVVGEGHDNETADSQTENVADNGFLHIVLSLVPLTATCHQPLLLGASWKNNVGEC